MAETEQVGLQLDKSFEQDAAKAAAATEKLDAALGGVGSKAKGVTAAEQAMRKLRKESDAAAAAMRKAAGNGGTGGITTTALLGTRQQGGFERIVGTVGKLFGDRAATGLVKGAAALARADDSLKPFGLSLEGGASALVGAGGALLSAFKVGGEVALGLTAAAVALTAAFYKYGIEQTSKREMANDALAARALQNGHEFTLDIAAKYGINEDDALHQVQKLLNAKFSQKEIPALIRIKAGMDAAGLNGDELLQKLEEIRLRPKVDAKAVKSLAAAGLDTKDVYAELAKILGTDVPTATARVKAGAVDAGAVIAAAEKVAGDRWGGMADKLGNSVPGLLNRIKIAFGSLFDAMDLGPLKGFLQNVAGALEGNAGSDVKVAASQLFGAISHTLFDPFQGPGGQQKLENMLRAIASLMRDAADAARDLGPIVSLAADALSSLGDNSTRANVGLELIKDTALSLLGPITSTVDELRLLGSILGVLGGGSSGGGTAAKAHDIMMGPAAGAANDNAGPGGADTGSAFSDGFVNGILAGQVPAINAARALVRGAVDAAHEEADAHSPSRKLIALGQVGFGGGLTVGMGRAENDVARAGADLVGAGMGGASQGMASGAPSPAAAGHGPVTINLTVNGGAGSAQDIAMEVRKQLVLALRDLGLEAA